VSPTTGNVPDVAYPVVVAVQTRLSLSFRFMFFMAYMPLLYLNHNPKTTIKKGGPGLRMALMTFEYKGREVLSPKYDEVFKYVFLGRDKHPIASFLSAVLRREVLAGGLDSYSPELHKNHRKNKGVRLDIVVKLPDGSVINIEMQVEDEGNMAQRSVYNTALLLADQLCKREDYKLTRPVIGINILDFDYLPNPNKYITRFRMKEVEDNIELPGAALQEIIFIELSKLPDNLGESVLDLWLRFLSVKTGKELEMLATKSPELKTAVEKLVSFSAPEKRRYRKFFIEKAERDQISRENWLIHKAKEEDARNMIAKGCDADFIMDITGLTVEEIARLQKGD